MCSWQAINESVKVIVKWVRVIFLLFFFFNKKNVMIAPLHSGAQTTSALASCIYKTAAKNIIGNKIHSVIHGG